MTAEEADPDIKNILNGLNASAGVFAKARGLDESLAGMDIINDVVAGINLLRQAKSEYPEIKSGNGKSRIANQLKQAMSQGDIFGKTNKPEVEQIALMLAENIRSGKRIGEFIGNIGTMLKEYITDLPQMDLFGNKQEVTSADLIERSKKMAGGKNMKTNKETSLKSPRKLTQEESRAVTQMILKKAMEQANKADTPGEPPMRWVDLKEE